MPSIEVEHLVVRYGELRALDDATVRIGEGRVTALIGMNGAGKSTLFNAIMGLVRPDSGEVRVEGGTPAAARRSGLVAYVPQHEAVDWQFPVSVRDVVMMGRFGHQGPTRRPRRTDRVAVADALARVGLDEHTDRQIGQLSGGQKKRAFVARAIAQDARVLLLDEPFAGVDKGSEATVTRLLRELAASGRTVLASTHDLHGVRRLADDAVLLNRRVLLHGPVDAVVRPDHLAEAFGLDPGDIGPLDDLGGVA
jgi:manganese transport system ATP-binding protein